MRHDHPAPERRYPLLIAGFSALVGASAVLAGAAGAAEPPIEMGLWYNHTGKGAVEIRPCAETGRGADLLCGFIVWLRNPENSKGEPLTDAYNQDPAKRGRPICGLPVLGMLRPMSDGSWDQGWVYDPEQGKSFDAAIKLRTRDSLVLTGYKGVKFFSKSFEWKRAPDDLPRCNEADEQARAEPAAAVAPAATATSAKPTATPPIPDKASQARASQASRMIEAPAPVPAIRPSITR
jgi:uncharacterized protein (DUF2147 family)